MLTILVEMVRVNTPDAEKTATVTAVIKIVGAMMTFLVLINDENTSPHPLRSSELHGKTVCYYEVLSLAFSCVFKVLVTLEMKIK